MPQRRRNRSSHSSRSGKSSGRSHSTRRSSRNNNSRGSRTHSRGKSAQRGGKRKAATTRAGKYVKKEMEHAERGKHTVKSRKQAVAIGLSKARRAGLRVPARKRRSRGQSSKRK